jgi:ethanolamine utilization protein EutQ
MSSTQNAPGKARVRAKRFSDLKFSPRFEYGHMAEVVEICGSADGSELGSGFVRLKNARIPWTIQYDEVLIVFEGLLRVHTGDEIHELHARDSLWLPAGTELVYESDNALVAYAIHPSNWSE